MDNFEDMLIGLKIKEREIKVTKDTIDSDDLGKINSPPVSYFVNFKYLNYIFVLKNGQFVRLRITDIKSYRYISLFKRFRELISKEKNKWNEEQL